MIVKLMTEHHLEFLSLKGGCTGSSDSTNVKMRHCWKSHALAQLFSVMLGTDEERGIKKWRKLDITGLSMNSEAMKTYDLPLIQKYLNKGNFWSYLPFCPSFSMKCRCRVLKGEEKSHSREEENSVQDGYLTNVRSEAEKTHL